MLVWQQIFSYLLVETPELEKKVVYSGVRTSLTFQKSNFHFRRLSNKFEISVKSSNMLLVTVWNKHTSHPKSVAKYVQVSIENVIFQWVYKPRFGFIPFFLPCLRCVRPLARNVMTSVTSNMDSLMPYHIDIQAAGLLWNNSIDNSIQEQHHKTNNMFIFCG